MDQKLPEEDAIRRYLLGALPEPELSQLEQRLMSNEALSETAELLEDEILDQYLEGDLDDTEQRAVEAHFLRPPARREQLRFRRLLRHRSAAESGGSYGIKLRTPPQPHPSPPRGRLWTYGGATVAALLGASTLYLGIVQHDLAIKLADSKKRQADLQADLANERGRSENLTAQVQALQTSSLVSLDLRPGVTRGSGNVQKATIHPSARFLRVNLILPRASTVPSSVRVRLMDVRKGEEVWSQTGLHPIPAPPLSQLEFYVPAQTFRSGPYDFVVEPNKGSSETYPINVDAIP